MGLPSFWTILEHRSRKWTERWQIRERPSEGAPRDAAVGAGCVWLGLAGFIFIFKDAEPKQPGPRGDTTKGRSFWVFHAPYSTRV